MEKTMRRSASEIIRNLEVRIARLEKSALGIPHGPFSNYTPKNFLNHLMGEGRHDLSNIVIKSRRLNRFGEVEGEILGNSRGEGFFDITIGVSPKHPDEYIIVKFYTSKRMSGKRHLVDSMEFDASPDEMRLFEEMVHIKAR